MLEKHQRDDVGRARRLKSWVRIWVLCQRGIEPATKPSKVSTAVVASSSDLTEGVIAMRAVLCLGTSYRKLMVCRLDPCALTGCLVSGFLFCEEWRF